MCRLTVLSHNGIDVQHDDIDIAHRKSVRNELPDSRRASSYDDELVAPVQTRGSKEQVTLVSMETGTPLQKP